MKLNPDRSEGPAEMIGRIGASGFMGDVSASPASRSRSISAAKGRSGLSWREFFERLGDGSLPARLALVTP